MDILCVRRALFSSDQSFPLAGAFAYSVYKFQNKRIKANPEGPHFGGNPIVGALVTTLFTIGVACAVSCVPCKVHCSTHALEVQRQSKAGACVASRQRTCCGGVIGKATSASVTQLA